MLKYLDLPLLPGIDGRILSLVECNCGGEPVIDRITWYNNDDGTVRQVWEKLEEEIVDALPSASIEGAHEILLHIRNGLGGRDPEV